MSPQVPNKTNIPFLENKVKELTMRIQIPYLRLILWASMLGALFLGACNLQEGKTEQTISFNPLFDELQGYDSVRITLKNLSGNTIDVVFDRKVKNVGDLENLPAPHWDGGKVLVSIQAYDAAGNLVLRSETEFDGKTDSKGNTNIYVTPEVRLSIPVNEILIREGDTLKLPTLVFNPPDIKDPRITWSSSEADIVEVLENTSVLGLKTGISQLTAVLVVAPTKKVNLKVTVSERLRPPESIKLADDTLAPAIDGPVLQANFTLKPSNAIGKIKWRLSDSTLASVDSVGFVKGLKVGSTKLFIRSTILESVLDSLVVVVSESVIPTGVLFSAKSMNIFQGGTAETLMVSVLPPKANQDVAISVSDTKILGFEKGKLVGLLEGEAYVIARSRLNAKLVDSLKVKVSAKQVVQSVKLSEAAITLYTGGPTKTLIATVLHSSMSQNVKWLSRNANIAKVENGVVQGISAGRTWILATSQVDSTKMDSTETTVKTDAPVLSVGRSDTTVSLGSKVTFTPVVAKQEYGEVVAFLSDLDGIAGWEDSVSTIKPITLNCDIEKTYVLRFLVRDTEGNEGQATKRIKVVSGPAVVIKSPAPNAYFSKAAIKIEWTVNGIVQTTGTDTVLKVGANSITRSALDSAGKVYSTQVTVYFDSTAPAEPNFILQPPSVVNKQNSNAQLIWTWNRIVGADTFIVRINGAIIARQTDTSYALPGFVDQVYALEVSALDKAGNTSSFKAATKVLVDRVAPNVPKIDLPKEFAKVAKWTWTSGGGGSGAFTCYLDAKKISDCKSGSSLDSSEGLHTLRVVEMDSAGNTSEYSSNSTIIVDRSKPTLSQKNYSTIASQVTNKVVDIEGIASDDRPGVLVRYQIDNGTAKNCGAENWKILAPTPALSAGNHTFTVTAEDVAGNTESITFTITYQPDVLFVRQSATKGKNNGSSWEDAYIDLTMVLGTANKYGSGKNVWVTGGEYPASVAGGFKIGSNCQLIGGFAKDGSNRSVSDRDLVNQNTILTRNPDPSTKYVLANVVDLGTSPMAYSENIQISDIEITSFRAAVIHLDSAKKVRLKNVKIFPMDLSEVTAVYIGASTVDLIDCEIDGKKAGSWANGFGIEIFTGSAVRLTGKSKIGNFYFRYNAPTGLIISESAACLGAQVAFYNNLPEDIGGYASLSYEDGFDWTDIYFDDRAKKVTTCPAPF
jgi:Bacterial Ig-like domain (group 3)/Bacterial Ig-like domain